MKDILEQINHKDGMTVPEGYFEDFASRMAASLPVRDWEENRGKVMPRSFWQKVRPYVYLAAMFAGVWSMMTMFDMMRPASPDFHSRTTPDLPPLSTMTASSTTMSSTKAEWMNT